MNKPSDKKNWRQKSTPSVGGSQRAGWRRTGKKGTEGTEQHWKRTRERTISPVAIKRIKLLFYVAGLLTMLAIFVAWMLFRPRPVPLIAMTVVAYNEPWDPNAYAMEDSLRFEQVFRGYRNVHFNRRVEGSDGHWKTLLDRQLEKCRSGGPGNGRLFPDNDVLILYISAHGVVDRQGRPTLLMSDSDPLDDSTWVPVLDLIAHINRHEHVQASRKVLILDAGRIRENWSAGILCNGFADVLQETLHKSRIPRLYVLNSTQHSQRGFAAPELGGSVFAYFVAAGLRGAADTNDDGEIWLREFSDYLRNQVASWANHHRTAPQSPLLVAGDAEDFGLAYVTRYIKPEIASTQPDSKDWATIDQLWQRYTTLEQTGLYRRAPLDCAALQSRLTRLEALFLAGEAYVEQLRATATAIERSLAEAESNATLLRPQLTGSSLTLLRKLGQLPTAEIEAASIVFGQWKQRLEAPETGALKELPLVSYSAASAAIWQQLCQLPAVSREQIAVAMNFLDTSQDQPPVPIKEMALLKMLHDHLDWDSAGAFVTRALAGQVVAERVSVPDDMRTQYWIRPLVDKREQQVRTARDELFVGNAAALSMAEERWSALMGNGDGGQYAEAEHISQVISNAYATRDRVWAKVPYLAQWLLSYADLPDRSLLVNDLLELMRRNRDLSAALDWRGKRGVVVSDAEEIRQPASDIVTRLDNLLGRYQRICGELSVAKAGAVGATLNNIMTVLEVPLVSEQRAELRQKLFSNLISTVEIQDRGATMPADADVDDTAFLTWLTDLQVHPALAVLDRTAVTAGDTNITPVKVFPPIDTGALTLEQARQLRLARLAAMGGEMRDRLADIEEVQRHLAAETEQMLASGSDQTPEIVRWGTSKADQVVRSAAGLLGRRPWLSAADDPSHKLQQFDLHFLLMWHGRRVLDDFWGPPTIGGPDFFAESARQHLVVAKPLCREAHTYHEQFTDSLTRLEKTATNWAPVTAKDVDVVEGQRLIRHQVNWLPEPAMPAGEAALFLRWMGGRLVPLADLATQAPLRRRAVEVDGVETTGPIKFLIVNDDDQELSGTMEAVAFYRGHVRTAGFFVGQEKAGATVTYQSQQLGPPRIRVIGDSTQKTQIIFILDCSGSMKEEMSIETQQRLTRLQIARSRLLEVLDSLEEDFYQVGLVLYGHRAGWKAVGSSRYEMVWRSDEDARRKLHPAEDVQLVVPVSPMRFTDIGGEIRDVRQVIAAKLSDLRPYGETPLYFALTEALQSFNRDLPGPRHVVVITDGVNEQTSEGARTDVLKHRDDVQQALKNTQTRAQIDIIGFGLKSRFSNAAEEQKWQRGQADLKRIARDPLSGGEFHEARDPSTLLQKLRDSLRLVKFYVERSDGPSPEPTEFLDLNQTWTLRQFEPGTNYTIRLDGPESEVVETVPLEGGESLLLVFNRTANRLEHLRFDKELRAAVEDIRDPRLPDRRFFVGAHLPQRQGGAEVCFRLSVQNAVAHQFSPRPRQIWAEIRPLPARDRVFYVSDAEIEAEQPVPLLRLRVSPWPLEVQRAEVRLWFTMTEDIGARSYDLDLGKPQSVDLTGVNVQVESQPGNEGDPYRVVAIEQHTENSDLYPLRLQMRPPPEYITHNYLAEEAKVYHLFAYNDRTFWKQENPQLIVIPIRQQGVLDTWVSTGPIEVDLTRR